MLDELVNCIEKLQTRMENHTESLQVNEWRTRTQLIDPLLSALSWDVSDPQLVIPEYNTGGAKRADYALMQSNGIPVAIIEAKHLGANLDDHLEKTIGYAIGQGIGYVGLTDGNKWRLYDVFQPVALEKKRVLDLSIIAEPPLVAIKLLILWRPILSGNYLAETAAELEQVEDLIKGDHPSPDPPPPDPSGDWVSLAKYNPPPRTPSPSLVKFWDGDVQSLNHWYDLLVRTAQKLYREGILSFDDTPIQLDQGSKRYVINNEAKHPGGKDFFQFFEIGDPPLYVETHYSAKKLRDLTLKLLKKYDKDSPEVS